MKRNRIVSIIVLVVMLLSVFSSTAFATEQKATTITVVQEITLANGTISTKKAFDSILPQNELKGMIGGIFSVGNLIKLANAKKVNYQIIVPSSAKVAGLQNIGTNLQTAIWQNTYSKATGILWWKKTILVTEKHALLVMDKKAIYQKLTSEGDNSFSSFSKLLTIK